MTAQLSLIETVDLPTEPDLDSYDRIIVFFSGGKDSLGCLLSLLDAGVERRKIQLWHHLIDGQSDTFMDWAVTEDYVRKLGAALGVSVRFSFREGGFKREMLRDNERTARVRFERENGTLGSAGGTDGPLGTRRLFPQQSHSLSNRWCSAALKVDVAAAALRNQPETFNHSRTLVLSGERGQESKRRGGYAKFEPHRSDLRHGAAKRLIDHWRPIRDWLESDVWALIQRFGVQPHPSYLLGFGRCSCIACIFCSADQLASIYRHAPARIEALSDYESEFGVTVSRNRAGIMDRVAAGTSYEVEDKSLTRFYTQKVFDLPILVPPAEWKLPLGAYGDPTGPS